MCTGCEERDERIRQLERDLYQRDWYPPREFKLTSMEGAILACLYGSERGRSIDFLISATRGLPGIKMDYPAPNAISAKICHLRAKIKPFGLEIECMWGAGYRLTADTRHRLLNWNTASTSPPAKRPRAAA